MNNIILPVDIFDSIKNTFNFKIKYGSEKEFIDNDTLTVLEDIFIDDDMDNVAYHEFILLFDFEVLLDFNETIIKIIWKN